MPDWRRWRERFDAFPMQGVLFGLWLTVGAVVTYRLMNSTRWVNFQSYYAIVVMHWIGYLAWRAKRAAQRRDRAGKIPTDS